MIKFLSALALTFCAYLALLKWCPLEYMMMGAWVAGHFVCYWWCALVLFFLLSYNSMK